MRGSRFQATHPMHRFGNGTLLAAGGASAPSSLLTGLRARWSLDEASGATRLDSVGSSHALLNGTVTSVTGKFGNGASFNGNPANYLSAAHTAALALAGGSFTVAFNYKFNVLTNQGFLSKFGGSGGNEFIIDYAATGTQIRFLLYGAGTAILGIVPTTLDTTTFYAVRAWYHQPTNTQWLQWEGMTPVTQSATAGGMNVSDAALRFGVFDGSTRPGNNVMDEVTIWDRVLTDAEWTEWRAKAYPYA